MFFEMYADKGEEVAGIIKEAAIEEKGAFDDVSDHSQRIKNKVQALKRRPTLKLDQAPKGLNPPHDDDYENIQ